MLFFKKLQEIQNFMQQYIEFRYYFIEHSLGSVGTHYFVQEVFIRSDFRIVTPFKNKFPKDSDIQRNRKFGHGRECFAPPSPYLWGCSKYISRASQTTNSLVHDSEQTFCIRTSNHEHEHFWGLPCARFGANIDHSYHDP